MLVQFLTLSDVQLGE